MAVVVTTCNDHQFLDGALQSLVGQTRPADEIVVVDDGSREDPSPVLAGYPEVRLLRQANAGLAAARNTGLSACSADYVVFLDADDRLTARALELGLACHTRHPGAGFVYGAHRRVDPEWRPLGETGFTPCPARPHRALLRGNIVGCCSAAMFDRAMLAAAGGFDATLGRCEDYEAFLRLAASHPVASHPQPVAEYRIHGGNMSGDPAAMLHWALRVLDRNRPPRADDEAMAAWRDGRRRWKLLYAMAAWRDGFPGARRGVLLQAPLTGAAAGLWHAAMRLLPAGTISRLRAWAKRRWDGGRAATARPGIEPASRDFGFDRGTPIDRWYIARFLARHARDIRGRALEVGDDSYCRAFGNDIERQDVLHVRAGNPGATIVGDITEPGLLPEAAFDCMVVTQTLHFVYDMRAAVAALHRALAPGGTLLLTVPGVSSVDRGEWGSSWFWSLTGPAAERLFADAFGADNVEVEVEGNYFAAASFLQGLAAEEIDTALMEGHDPAYPVTVCVRARRAG